MVLQVDDPLQDGRVILGVGVDLSPDLPVQALLEHEFLDDHDLFEDCEDIGLGMLKGIEEVEALFGAAWRGGYLLLGV